VESLRPIYYTANAMSLAGAILEMKGDATLAMRAGEERWKGNDTSTALLITPSPSYRHIYSARWRTGCFADHVSNAVLLSATWSAAMRHNHPLNYERHFTTNTGHHSTAHFPFAPPSRLHFPRSTFSTLATIHRHPSNDAIISLQPLCLRGRGALWGSRAPAEIDSGAQHHHSSTQSSPVRRTAAHVDRRQSSVKSGH